METSTNRTSFSHRRTMVTLAVSKHTSRGALALGTVPEVLAAKMSR
jgi:hypothetical protein